MATWLLASAAPPQFPIRQPSSLRGRTAALEDYAAKTPPLRPFPPPHAPASAPNVGYETPISVVKMRFSQEFAVFKHAIHFAIAMAPLFGLAVAAASRAETPAKVTGPHTHENLSIYFIHGPSSSGPVPLTLEEALAKNFVEVRETDTVSQLIIENKGKEAVFVQAGDIVKGGKQDRVVTASFTLDPGAKPVDVPVYCVEAGRWAPRGSEDSRKFSASAEMLPTREAKLAMMATASIPRIETPPNPGLPPLPEQRANVGRDQIQQQRIVLPEHRPPNAQSEVWRNVSEIQAKLAGKLKAKVAASDSETSLQLALENKELAAEQQRYVAALQDAGASGSDIVGYAIAINGKIASADVYASNALFRKLWPRLLKTAATEAISAEHDQAAKAPATADVIAFLAEDAGKGDVSAPVPGVTRSTKETAEAHDSVTRAADGHFLHRAKVRR